MPSTRASASPPVSMRSPPITAARRSPACWPVPRSPPRRGPPRNASCAPRRRNVIPGRCEASNPESRDSGSGACAPSRNDDLAADRLVQIFPLRILHFDQFHLPITLPFLKFFFAGNRCSRIIVDFEPNEPCDIVLGREAGDGLYSVLLDPAHDIVCHAHVNRSILSARQDVHVVGHDNGAPSSRDSGTGP